MSNIDIDLVKSIDSEINKWETSYSDIQVETLDMPISLQEYKECLKSLKNEKSSGYDTISNEFLKNNSDDFHYVLLKLFNQILSSGIFPKEWAIGELIPIHKKGDPNNPDNYRGITLMTCMGKLFTSIINNRLQTFAEDKLHFQ